MGFPSSTHILALGPVLDRDGMTYDVRSRGHNPRIKVLVLEVPNIDEFPRRGSRRSLDWTQDRGSGLKTLGGLESSTPRPVSHPSGPSPSCLTGGVHCGVERRVEVTLRQDAVVETVAHDAGLPTTPNQTPGVDTDRVKEVSGPVVDGRREPVLEDEGGRVDQ